MRGRLKAQYGLYKDRQTARRYARRDIGTPEELVAAHFDVWSEPYHVNKRGFEVAVNEMAGRPRNIVETGTSAWGVDSTRLWDAYARRFGGRFWSVDISQAPKKRLRNQVGRYTSLVIGDSVEFLSSFPQTYGSTVIDVCYLDSWDLDWSDPWPAALHGEAEWRAAKPLLSEGSLIVLDDTPVSLEWVPGEHREAAANHLETFGHLPGKGALVVQELESSNQFERLWHGYNAVFRCTK